MHIFTYFSAVLPYLYAHNIFYKDSYLMYNNIKLNDRYLCAEYISINMTFFCLISRDYSALTSYVIRIEKPKGVTLTL